MTKKKLKILKSQWIYWTASHRVRNRIRETENESELDGIMKMKQLTVDEIRRDSEGGIGSWHFPGLIPGY